jgi:glycosyltransferase involved in cell wall biosynthesis
MADRLRVLLDCRMATWTGVGRYTVGLARALARIDDIELIQVIADGEQPPVAVRAQADEVGGASAASEPISASKHPFTLGGGRELARIARDIKPDVLHCPHFPTPLPATHPLVVTTHDLTPLVVPGVMPGRVKRAVYRWWNHRAVRVADQIITDASFTLGEIERIFPHAAGRITAIPLGVDDFASVQFRPVAKRDGRAPYVLSMGSTREHKDLPTLLRAFATVASGRPDLRLLLVGADEPGYLDRESALASPAIRARVAFTGRIDDDTLRGLMAGAEAFVFPSQYEGFGLPPLEAMAMGAPTMVADVASLPEVVGDGALRFAVGDADELAVKLEGLLGDVGLQQRLAEAGPVRASAFTWARTAAATVDVYRDVVRRA